MNIPASPTAIVNHVMESGTPVNAVAASGTLTISGVAIDAETITIGADTYEFAADADQTVTSGNIAIDITDETTAAQGTLTIDAQVTADDTMTIGTKTYTFVADGTAASDGEINVGSDEADGKTDIVAAINGTDGYNVANTLVTAGTFSGDDLVLTAKTKGIAGDEIVTTETFTNAANEFDATTLGTTTAGVNATQGKQGQTQQDSSYWYLCIADNTINDTNWRRFAVGSVY